MHARQPDLHSSNLDQPSAEEVMHSLAAILASAAFSKAPRMCHLLRFLVEKKMAGQAHHIHEYAIGLEVFGRDARSYDTGADPLVRVQCGRLRERLNVYYACATDTNAVHISIPLGQYVPLLQRIRPAAPPPPNAMALMPLCDIGGHPAFVRGVDEELGSHLFAAFGSALALHEGAAAPAAQRLEGSIRIEPGHVRACMRLVDAEGGRIRWRSQFDGHGELDMQLQGQLAGAICASLQDWFATGVTVTPPAVTARY